MVAARGKGLIKRYALAAALFAGSLGCAVLAGTAPADPADRGAVSSQADIEAEGCVDFECDEDGDSDGAFNSFDERASASLKTGNGKIEAHSSQDTSIFAPAGPVDRILSKAAGDAFMTQDLPSRSSAFGGGNMSVGFTVESLVDYSILGSMRVSGKPNSECSEVRVTLEGSESVFVGRVAAPSGCGAESSMGFSQSGTLAPGGYTVSAGIRADATSETRSSTFASGSYKFRLLLDELACTVQITEPGETTQGTAGDDVICGTPGNDTIDGLGGDDTIYGEGGSDTIDGGPGPDAILGNDGEDCLLGGDGQDNLKGEGGDDKFIANEGTKDVVNGGPAPDKGRFDGRDDVRSVADTRASGGC